MAIAFFRFPSLSSTKRITIIQGQSRNLDLRGVFLKKKPALLVISTKPGDLQEDIQHLQKYVADIRKHRWPETRMLYGGIKYGLSIAFEKVKARRVQTVAEIVDLARKFGHPDGETVAKWIEDGLAICPGIGPWAKTGGRISFQGDTPRHLLLRAQGAKDAVRLFPNMSSATSVSVPEHVPRIRRVEPQPGIVVKDGKVSFKGVFAPALGASEEQQHMAPGPKDDLYVPPKPAPAIRKVEAASMPTPEEMAEKRRQLDEITALIQERERERLEREQREMSEIIQMIDETPAVENEHSELSKPHQPRSELLRSLEQKRREVEELQQMLEQAEQRQKKSELLRKFVHKLESAEDVQTPPPPTAPTRISSPIARLSPSPPTSPQGNSMTSAHPGPPPSSNPTLPPPPPPHPPGAHPSSSTNPRARLLRVDQPSPTPHPQPSSHPHPHIATWATLPPRKTPPCTSSLPTTCPATKPTAPLPAGAASTDPAHPANPSAAAEGSGKGVKIVRYAQDRPLIRYHMVSKPLKSGLVRKHYCGDPDNSGLVVGGAREE
ncbi:hypothetical protein FN846DRAFT_981571 [Sphaerosporella brunnea]|uniref:Uncharacterized protein n=1 Tax=Sphaerosporella brunnea TaxID=1250544 RepID=A0A5J5ECE7_9PEZI|nr:hypothetical protein FN846DRAFT_981571 [Sphaerosporella brunnea]